MKKIDWTKKLTSRKFWLAVVGAVVPYMLAFGHSEEEVAQITAIIMGTGALIAYILAEGMIDAEHASKDQTHDQPSDA